MSLKTTELQTIHFYNNLLMFTIIHMFQQVIPNFKGQFASHEVKDPVFLKLDSVQRIKEEYPGQFGHFNFYIKFLFKLFFYKFPSFMKVKY